MKNYQRLTERPIAGLRLIKERMKRPPEGHRAISRPESIRRAAPLVHEIVQGTVPLDDANKDAFALIAENEYRKHQRLARQ